MWQPSRKESGVSSKAGKRRAAAGSRVPPRGGWDELVLAVAFLRKEMFAHLQRHGNSRWQPLTLAMLAVLWSWGTSDQTLDGRFQAAASLVLGWSESTYVFTTCKGFIGALATWNNELIAIVRQALQRQMQTLLCWNGRPMFGIDGTKVGVPWTDSTDRELGQQTLRGRKKKKNKKKRRGGTAKPKSASSQAHQEVRPQLLLTLVWHMASGLPWSWKSGPVSGSERDDARELVRSLPARSILVCDAGFTGYELWQEMLAAGHDFVIRIGSNVKLLKNLGWKVRFKGEFAFLWPDGQQRAGAAPLVVRLARFQTRRTTVWLAMSVLDGSELGDKELGDKELGDKELADIYRLRWGIEGWFRSLKQTFGRRTLRSRDAGHARCELDWSIVGLGLIQLQGVQALEAAGQDADRLSEAEAIRVVRGTILHADFSVRHLPTLTQRLQRAVLDTYQRTRPKQGRHIHRKKQHKSAGDPRVVEATPEQQLLASQLQAAQAAA